MSSELAVAISVGLLSRFVETFLEVFRCVPSLLLCTQPRLVLFECHCGEYSVLDAFRVVMSPSLVLANRQPRTTCGQLFWPTVSHVPLVGSCSGQPSATYHLWAVVGCTAFVITFIYAIFHLCKFSARNDSTQ